MSLVNNRMLRVLLFIMGCVALICGLVGAFLPVLPTTPFVLLAGWCFLKSSPKAHRWLYNQPLLGKVLNDWEKNRSISRPTKVVAISTISLSAVFMWTQVSILWVNILVTLVLILVSCFILTRPENTDTL